MATKEKSGASHSKADMTRKYVALLEEACEGDIKTLIPLFVHIGKAKE